jgi:ABC-type Fe3+-hydroxamate transport system substrate-binding protein
MITNKKVAVKKIFDQLGREVEVPFPPKRIISLVPSQTELLFDLGLDQEIVGITKFCIHPEDIFKVKKVGGTKNLNLDRIKILNPDLIIANKEENDEQQIKLLMQQYPVWISDIKSLEDAYQMIGIVGEMVNRKETAAALINDIKHEFRKISYLKKKTLVNTPTAGYLIWRNPYITVGNGTFINSMLELAGFTNVFIDRPRYPEIISKELIERSPQYLLLSSEPFPFKEKHMKELQALLPAAKILLVDGEMFSWYGSRLLKAPAYFSSINIDH